MARRKPVPFEVSGLRILTNGGEVDVQLNRSFKVVVDDAGKPAERGD